MSDSTTGFVDVVISATGERTQIPAHWLDVPQLAAPYEPYVIPDVPLPQPASQPLVDEQTAVQNPPPPPAPPAESAHKDDWIAWAVTSEVAGGLTADEALTKVQDSTKAQLIADYGA